MCAKFHGSIVSINEDIRGGAQSTPLRFLTAKKGQSDWVNNAGGPRGSLICNHTVIHYVQNYCY